MTHPAALRHQLSPLMITRHSWPGTCGQLFPNILPRIGSSQQARASKQKNLPCLGPFCRRRGRQHANRQILAGMACHHPFSAQPQGQAEICPKKHGHTRPLGRSDARTGFDRTSTHPALGPRKGFSAQAPKKRISAAEVEGAVARARPVARTFQPTPPNTHNTQHILGLLPQRFTARLAPRADKLPTRAHTGNRTRPDTSTAWLAVPPIIPAGSNRRSGVLARSLPFHSFHSSSCTPVPGLNGSRPRLRWCCCRPSVADGVLPTGAKLFFFLIREIIFSHFLFLSFLGPLAFAGWSEHVACLVCKIFSSFIILLMIPCLLTFRP